MKKLLLCVVILTSLTACEKVKVRKDSSISAVEICNKRKAISARQSDFENLFIQCLNRPKRIQTGTDDESDVISECRLAARDIRGVIYEEEEFMRDTEAYIPDCLKLEN